MTKMGNYRFFKDDREYLDYKRGTILKQRCVAHNKKTGKRCKNWATIGRTLCLRHGGTALRPIKEGREYDFPLLTKKEREHAYKAFKLIMEDLVQRAGVDPFNCDKMLVYEAASAFVKSRRKFTDRMSYKEHKYRKEFIRILKELLLTRKEREASRVANKISKSFDMMLSDAT